MEEKDVFEFEITKNIVANFIDDEDKFIKQQTIDHIIQNGKCYDVINISKSKIKEIVENGLKYEQLKKENTYLKSAQNKVAIEKLEKVLHWIKLDSHKYGEDEDDWYSGLSKYIKTMLSELKGEKDE